VSPRPQRLFSRLTGCVLERFPEHAVGLDGRLRDWRDALVPGVDARAVPRDARLRERLRSPLSGSALVVNSFLPWRGTAARLSLLGLEGFEELRFHVRCPAGIRGTPPYLDLLARGDGLLLGITATGFEYLTPPRTRLRRAYLEVSRRNGCRPWIALARALEAGELRFSHVDVNALVRLAIGLSHSFPNYRTTLAYLYLEPRGSRLPVAFHRHRAELAELAARLGDSEPHFGYASFTELWQGWRDGAQPAWLRRLAAALEARYEVEGVESG